MAFADYSNYSSASYSPVHSETPKIGRHSSVKNKASRFAGFAQSLNVPYFLPEHFPDHHCAPPDENSEHLWFNLYSEITAANIGLLAVGQSIIKGELTRLSRLYKKQGRGYPSTRELAIHILKRANDSKGTVRDNLLRVGMHLMAFADYSNWLPHVQILRSQLLFSLIAKTSLPVLHSH